VLPRREVAVLVRSRAVPNEALLSSLHAKVAVVEPATEHERMSFWSGSTTAAYAYPFCSPLLMTTPSVVVSCTSARGTEPVRRDAAMRMSVTDVEAARSLEPETVTVKV